MIETIEKLKKEQEKEIKPLNEKDADNVTELGFKGSLIKVHAPVHEFIKEDFTLAYFDNEEVKEAVTAMITNCAHIERLFEKIALRAKEYFWDEEKHMWVDKQLSQIDGNTINTTGKSISSLYAIEVLMKAILNRNRYDNHTMNSLLEKVRDEGVAAQNTLEAIKIAAMRKEE